LRIVSSMFVPSVLDVLPARPVLEEPFCVDFARA
jgi:hypothetical protein